MSARNIALAAMAFYLLKADAFSSFGKAFDKLAFELFVPGFGSDVDGTFGAVKSAVRRMQHFGFRHRTIPLSVSIASFIGMFKK